ncbi:hypothetical protein B0O99DRAFT_687189 [Bisporella sp. PMI_857]|nr:hypothetical protein B0O99DRAFT_687189 [Bisporella sp. PMI_857]
MEGNTSPERPSNLFNYFFEDLRKESSPSTVLCIQPSATASLASATQNSLPLITPPPELRRRDALPEPQADCQQAQQSADQAIRQANQSASESIRQASESARQASQQFSQSADAASRSATDAIRQANQSASQSIAAASRTVSQATSSASSVVASIQSSAADAISRANVSADSARAAQTSAQEAASRAVLQAGAAVAAATGQAAAAGSSFLLAAAKATESASAFASAQAAAAAEQVSQAKLQASTSNTLAITATQVAIAIVGSIIASALITILIYFLIARHKKKAKRKTKQQPHTDLKSPDTAQAFETVRGYTADSKFPISDQTATTVAGSKPGTASGNRPPSSQASFSLFPKINQSSGNDSPIKTTSVKWNPENPPKPPTLGSWLKLQNTVSPFGPINLPMDKKSDSPLGGQLKSPLQSKDTKPANLQPPRFVSFLPLRSPKLPSLSFRTPKSPPVVARQDSFKGRQVSPEVPEGSLERGIENPNYRASKISVWTDDLVTDDPTPKIKSGRDTNDPPTVSKAYSMQLPPITKPVRTTAEWLQDQQRGPLKDPYSNPDLYRDSNRDPQQPLSPRQQILSSRPSFSMGLPKNPKAGGSNGLRSSQQQGLDRFLDGEKGSRLSGYPSASTPGVGKAL